MIVTSTTREVWVWVCSMSMSMRMRMTARATSMATGSTWWTTGNHCCTTSVPLCHVCARDVTHRPTPLMSQQHHHVATSDVTHCFWHNVLQCMSHSLHRHWCHTLTQWMSHISVSMSHTHTVACIMCDIISWQECNVIKCCWYYAQGYTTTIIPPVETCCNSTTVK